MNTAGCPLQRGEEGAATLLSYLDRQLDSETTALLDRHVAQCESCRRLVDAHRAVWNALDEYRPVSVSAEFDDRVMARIAAERDPWWRRMLPGEMPWWKAAMPLTAACALLVGVSFWRNPETAVSAPQRMDAAEVQQVEDTLSDVEMLRQLGLAGDGAAAVAPSSPQTL